jgi:hypothetical protein
MGMVLLALLVSSINGMPEESDVSFIITFEYICTRVAHDGNEDEPVKAYSGLGISSGTVRIGVT